MFSICLCLLYFLLCSYIWLHITPLKATHKSKHFYLTHMEKQNGTFTLNGKHTKLKVGARIEAGVTREFSGLSLPIHVTLSP